MILIISMFVVQKQMTFISNTNLGFKKENIVKLPYDTKISEAYSGLRTEFMKLAEVENVARSIESPVQINGGYSLSSHLLPDGHTIIVNALPADNQYIPTFEIELIEGKNFTENDMTREEGSLMPILLNERLVADLNIDPENAVGEKINFNGNDSEVIGVMKNFHFRSLRDDILPLVIFPNTDYLNMYVKLNTNDIKSTLSQLENQWGTLVNHRPFEFEFVDDQYNNLYKTDARLGSIFTVFAVLAIFIACLGLFGLVSFTATQRTKEIGVRKVMGASVPDLIFLLWKSFGILILISFVMAGPLGYFMMESWLEEFKYKVDIGILPIIGSLVVCLAIAVLTVGYRSFKAASSNPVDSFEN